VAQNEPSTSKRNQSNRKEIIKKSALKIFAQYGYKDTKTSMIASEAKVSEGLIFRHFYSKAQLFTGIIEELMFESQRQLNALQFLPGTPYQQIKALTERMLDENHKYSFMIVHQARKKEAVPTEINEIFTKYSPDYLIEILVPIFKKGQEMGEFSEGDPRKQLVWYFNIINSITMQEQVDGQFGLPNVEMLMKFLVNK
jgi:AcrR family transcriptional regulator